MAKFWMPVSIHENGIVKLSAFDQKLGNIRIHNSLQVSAI